MNLLPVYLFYMCIYACTYIWVYTYVHIHTIFNKIRIHNFASYSFHLIIYCKLSHCQIVFENMILKTKILTFWLSYVLQILSPFCCMPFNFVKMCSDMQTFKIFMLKNQTIFSHVFLPQILGLESLSPSTDQLKLNM